MSISGTYSDPLNWAGGVVADGADSIADFSTLDLGSDITVEFDLPRMLGSLFFGDIAPSHNWVIGAAAASPNILTLATTVPGTVPRITVNNQTATIQAPLAGTQGFIKDGAGTLVLSTNASTWTGNAIINSGTISIFTAQAAGSTFVLNNGVTLAGSSGLISTVNALAGSSTYSNLQLNTADVAFTGNGNILWINGSAAGNDSGPNPLLFAGYGGTITWGLSQGFGFRHNAATPRYGTFATLDFANTAVPTGFVLYTNGGNRIFVLGGIASTGLGSYLTASNNNSSGTTYIVGSANGDTTYSGGIGQAAAPGSTLLIKVGAGTLTMTDVAGTPYGTGITTPGTFAANGGILKIDYTAAPDGALRSNTLLSFGGGTLLLQAKSSGTTSQVTGAVTVAQGGGRLVVNPNNGTSTTVNMGVITATAVGGSWNIQPPDAALGSGTVTITTGTNKLADGTYGARITYGSDWATTISGTSPFVLSGYTGYNTLVPGFAGGVNTTNDQINGTSGSLVLTGSYVSNSLKINPDAGQSLTLDNNDLVFTNGGLLFSGSNNFSILQGAGGTGSVKSGTNSATVPDLIVQQLGTGTLTIAAGISNSGTGASTLTKAGSGTLILSGSNTYSGPTYLNDGVLSVSNDANLGLSATGATLNFNGGTLRATSTFTLDSDGLGTAVRAVTLGGGGGIFDVTAGNVLTVGGTISNLIATQLGPLIKTGSGTLNLTGANTYQGATIIRGGILNTSNITTELSGSAGATASGIGQSNNTAPALVLDGGTLQYAGAGVTTDRSFTVTANGGAISSMAGAISFSSATPAAIAASGTGNRTLTLAGDSPGANTIGLVIVDPSAGATSLAKTGVGKWILTGVNTYTGATTISGSSTLALSSTTTNNIASSSRISVGQGSTLDVTALNSGRIRLGGAQTLTGAGTVLGGVTTVFGSQISPGTILNNNGGQGTLTLGDLTLAAGTILNFGLSSANLDGGLGPNASLISAANLTLATSGTTIVQLFQPNSNSAFATAGTYDLIRYSGALTGSAASAFAIGNTGLGAFAYTFGTSGSYITVTLTQTSVIATWNNNGNGNWNNAANWIGGVPQLPGSSATFGPVITAPRTVTLDANESVAALNFSSTNSYTISGPNTLTFDNNGSTAAVNNTIGSHTVATKVKLNSNTAIEVTNSLDTLTFSGDIGNTAGTPTISKTGAGKLALSGSNSYGGAAGTVGTTLAAGALQVGHNSALGASDLAMTSNVTLQAGADGLNLANNMITTAGMTATVDTQANTLVLSGTLGQTGLSAALTKIGTGTLKLAANNTYTGATTITTGTLQLGNAGTGGSVAGAIVNNGALVLNRTDDYSLGNVISGSGSLTQAGLNNVTITAANTFSGNTVLSSGTLTIGNALALQNSALNYNFQGGTLSFGTVTAATIANLSGGQNLVLANTTGTAVALTLGGNESGSIYSGALSGPGSLIKTGAGLLTLTASNSYTGSTTINAGTVSIGANSVLTGEVNLTGIDGGSNLIVRDNAVISSTSAMILASGPLTIGLSTLVVRDNATINVPSLSLGNATRVPQGTSVTIQDNATLNVTGVFTLLSTVGSTASNDTLNLNGGILTVGSFLLTQGAAPGVQLTNINFNGGLLRPTASNPAFLPALSGLTARVLAGGARIDTSGFDITIAAALVSGTATDGGLTKTGEGMLTLVGNNTYLGPTLLNSGTLQLGDGFPGRDGNIISSSGIINNATLIYNLFGAVASSVVVSGTGSVAVMGEGAQIFTGTNTYTGTTTIENGATLQLGDGTAGNDGTINNTPGILNSGTLTYNRFGNLSSGLVISGTGAVVVSGSGSQTLTGVQTYTGGTVVNGRLIVSGSLIGTSAVEVAVDAVLTDDGFINNAATVTSVGTVRGRGSLGTILIAGTGTLAPGSTDASASAGTLTANGDVTLTDNTSNFSIRLGVGSATDNDKLAIAGGTLSLNGATLQLTTGVNYVRQADGFTYVIINGGAGSAGTGANIFAQGSSVTASNGDIFNILYGSNAAGTGIGNDVVLQLQAIPEPGTWALLAGGVGMLVVRRRWRSSRRSF